MPHGARHRDPDYTDRDIDRGWDRRGPAANGSYYRKPAERASGSRSRRSGPPNGSGAPRPGAARRPGAPRQRDLRGSWRRQSPVAKVGYIFATLVAVLAVAVSLGGFAIYRQLTGNITKVNVAGLSGKTIYGSLNILVLGSQTRLHQRGHFGYDSNPGVSNSDNLLIVHLDPTHTHAVVLSIPRDTFVYEPACKERAYVGNGTWPAQAYPPGAIIDGALNIGGPNCAVATVEALTGIKLDHFVEFNFNSFRTMVGQLGGVWVCVPRGGYHDRATNTNLKAGKHLLNYTAALQYVRNRHGVGSGADAGGDLPRIQLQQAFISSVIQQINKNGLLSDLPKLLHIAGTATKALTIDSGLGSTTSLLRLAQSLVHLKSRNVTLITVPSTMDTYNYPTYSSHLMTVQPQDDVLFQMIRSGEPWPGHLPVQPYSSVQVKVVNATGQSGLANRTRTALRRLGFDVVGVGDAAYTNTSTVQYAGLAQADSAYTVMTALMATPSGQNTLVEPAPQEGSTGPVTLVLGADFKGVNPAAVVSTTTAKATKHHRRATTGQPAPSNSAGTVQSRNAGASICSGLPPAYNPGG
jgi:LCP family protein required for cell wall assembly